MSHTLDVFAYADRQVRTILADGEPWFVAADVCRILGHSNPTAAVAGLDDDEKGLSIVETPSGDQQMVTINEPGLYSLIIRSRKPEARAFKRWVTHEVLPAIRRTGKYDATVPKTYVEALRAAADAAEEADRAREALALAAPKVESFDAFMQADGCYSMEAAAKSLADVTGGMGRNKLFAWLREHKYLMPNNNPYQQYVRWFKVVVGSYTDSQGVEHTTRTTHVRPEGLDALRRKFEASS